MNSELLALFVVALIGSFIAHGCINGRSVGSEGDGKTAAGEATTTTTTTTTVTKTTAKATTTTTADDDDDDEQPFVTLKMTDGDDGGFEEESRVVVAISEDRSAICHLEPETGSCKAYFIRYHFDPKLEKCKKFVYGGCDGNDNNFGTEEECMAFCNAKDISNAKKDELLESTTATTTKAINAASYHSKPQSQSSPVTPGVVRKCKHGAKEDTCRHEHGDDFDGPED